MPISACLGLLLAVMFNAKFHFKEFFKAIYFSPMVTSTVAAAMVWWWMYNPQFGIFNVLLKLVGIPEQPWLMSSHMALPSIIIFSMWKNLGYNMIIYLAGLQAIPPQFYEAATIDGANASRSDSGTSRSRSWLPRPPSSSSTIASSRSRSSTRSSS